MCSPPRLFGRERAKTCSFGSKASCRLAALSRTWRLPDRQDRDSGRDGLRGRIRRRGHSRAVDGSPHDPLQHGHRSRRASRKLLPRECSNMLLTMPSARRPCSAIFSRLPVNIPIVSSISARLSSPSVAIAGPGIDRPVEFVRFEQVRDRKVKSSGPCFFPTRATARGGSGGIVEALIRAKQRPGVDVRPIADKTTPCPQASGIAPRPDRAREPATSRWRGAEFSAAPSSRSSRAAA
jgi:hypothetical protein